MGGSAGYSRFCSHEQPEDLGFKRLKRAAVHGLHPLLGLHDGLVGLVEELLPDGDLDPVPPRAQLGPLLENVQT